MRRQLFLAVGIAYIGIVAVRAGSAGPQTPAPAARPAGHPDAALLTEYCAACHNQRLNTAATASGVVFDRLDPANVGAAPEVWEKVVRRLANGSMPPQGARRPEPAVLDSLASRLAGRLDQAAAAQPNAGRPLLRRLNRTEYANAIRALLDLEIDAASLLPPDDSAFGFDNVADVLSISPALLERYVSAADRISELAVGDLSIAPGAQTYRVPLDRSQNQPIDGLPLGTVGGTSVTHVFPLDAQYEFQVRLLRTNLEMMRGMEHPHRLELLIDGQPVFTDVVGGPEDMVRARKWTDGADEIDARLKTRVPVTAGPHTVGVTFVRKVGAGTARLQAPLRSSADTFEPTGRPHVETFTITGPFTATGSGDTPSRRRVFSCRPASAAEERACARRIVGSLARQAFRRPIVARDMDALMAFYELGDKKNGFEGGVQMALRRMLASPDFVFRPEPDPPSARPGVPYRVGDVELASRLSFFLWSAPPDQPLLALAEQGRLSDDRVLDEQVRRMLADPRAEALVTNFAGQWLQLRNLRSARPNSFDFPDFDDNLRQGFRRETELLFEHIMRNDRSVLELLTADYTFLNERVARHYGVDGVYGNRFRRVPLAGRERRGILGHGSILTVTSHADRTSPVVRGKWILENLLGTPPPPAPPNVPALSENEEGAAPKSVRARMEQHRANPVCASCHRIMDPIGLSLENFDAVGAWRLEDAGTPIDASAQLFDGTPIDGVVALREALLKRPEIFVGTMTEKMLIYALGRGLGAQDFPVVRAIVRDAARQDYRFGALVRGVVHSVPFRMRMPAEAPVATSARR